jgi:hypothetical protein
MNGADSKSRHVTNIIHGVDDKELAPPKNGGLRCSSSGRDGDYNNHRATFGSSSGGDESINATLPSKSLSLIIPLSPPTPHIAVGCCPPPHVVSRRRRDRDCNHRNNNDASPGLALPCLVGVTVLILLLAALLLFSTNVVVPPLPQCAMSSLLSPLRAVGDDRS